MTIPIINEVWEILKKREGSFPDKQGHQEYNRNIKEVCKVAGLNGSCEGKVIVSIAPKGKKGTGSDLRRKLGIYPKWKLVSSHIGRRSFATNYYGRIPTTYLMYITGHSSEKTFLKYIKKSNSDLAKDAFDYFSSM